MRKHMGKDKVRQIYLRLLRFRTSQAAPSTTQLAQGVPESVTVHLTLRELHALHATDARLDGRDAAGAGEDIGSPGFACVTSHAVMDISCSTCYTVNDFLKTERTRGESGFLALAKT